MKPKVIFAYQAPTLINNFAECDTWDVSAADMGDGALEENRLLTTPRCSSMSGLAWVFVCSPLQLQNAQILSAQGTKVCWIMHNGKANEALKRIINAGNTHRIACMSQRNAEQVRAWFGDSVPISVLRPAYEPTFKWKVWARNLSWTLKNRPWARDRKALDVVHEVIKRAGAFDHKWFGEGQPEGFIMPKEKDRLLQKCSCYVSCLPEWAGFGLTEHECMAAGVPVVGSRWGDTRLHADHDWCLDDRVEVQIDTLKRLRDGTYGGSFRSMACQIEYLARFCSPEARRLSIEKFLDW